MTLAPARPASGPARRSSTPLASVLCVLVASESGPGLVSALDALTAQSRHPDALLVVDVTADGSVRADLAHHSLHNIETVVALRGEPGSSAQRAVNRAVLATTDDALRELINASDYLWFLAGSAAAPDALSRLLDAVRRSPSVSAAGPKQMRADAPSRLHSIGYQTTRTGRLIASPPSGEPDQGQYDRRTDVIAVPLDGLFIERELFVRLEGYDVSFGDVGADLDLGWRAQQSGRRVIAVPATRVLTHPGPGLSPQQRRQARRVALSRCSVLAVPFVALWLILSTGASALALLLVKRPRSAWREFADAGALLDPWRPAAARLRSHGLRTVARRHLRGLFVTSGAALRHGTDLVHDAVALEGRKAADAGGLAAIETGPSEEDGHDLNVMPEPWLGRALRNPGLIVTVLATVMTLVAGRSISGGLVQRFQSGLSGGSLIGVRASSSDLWHAFADSWKGSGFGHAGDASPHLAVLAGLAWLGEHIPFVDDAGSPSGAAIALLLTSALPLSTATAYLSARAITRSGWRRAIAALAWSSTAVASVAVANGRIGPVVAVLLLPLVAAGFARTASPHGSATATFATALGAAALGVFVPALLALFLASAVLLLLFGRGMARLRAIVLVALPLLLLGPWVSALQRDPRQIFAGPGVLSWGAPTADPWQLALLHTGGMGSYPVLLSVPLIALAVLGLLRGGRRGGALTALGLLGLVSLAGALAAPRIALGTVPAGLSGAGHPITMWSGVPLLVYALAVISAALVGISGLSLSRARSGWPAALRWPLVAAAGAAVLASAGYLAWGSFGTHLQAWKEPRTAVAVDQAGGDLANRMLFLEPSPQSMGYRIVGREVTDVVRPLPPARDSVYDDAAMTPTVSALIDGVRSPSEKQPGAILAGQGVGFLGLRADDTDPLIRRLDSTAGLVRQGARDGVIVWRVLPAGKTSTDLAPSRLRLVTAGGATESVPMTGAHGATHTGITGHARTQLVVAESQAWARDAEVRVNGKLVRPATLDPSPAYDVPPGTSQLVIDVGTDHRGWLVFQGILLALVAFLSLPLGRRSASAGRRSS